MKELITLEPKENHQSVLHLFEYNEYKLNILKSVKLYKNEDEEISKEAIELAKENGIDTTDEYWWNYQIEFGTPLRVVYDKLMDSELEGLMNKITDKEWGKLLNTKK